MADELNLNDPNLWNEVAALIVTKHDYHYDTSDDSHCIDLAQIVCLALAQIREARRKETEGTT